MLALISSAGCSSWRAVVIHPISETDFFSVEQVDKVVKVDGTEISVVKNGWFCSDYWINEVASAKVEK